MTAVKREYAVYHGDTLLAVGPAQFLAEYLGVKEKTIRYYTCPSYRRKIADASEPRLEVIRVEEDDD